MGFVVFLYLYYFVIDVMTFTLWVMAEKRGVKNIFKL